MIFQLMGEVCEAIGIIADGLKQTLKKNAI